MSPREPGNAEEGRNRVAIAERGGDGCDPGFDLRIRLLRRHAMEGERMGIAMRADGMSGRMNLAHRLGIGLRHPPDEEEGRLDAFGSENVESAGGVGRQRAVVEGQHDLMVGERQRLGILHHPEADMLGRVDHQGAAGAERVRLSRAFGSARRTRRDQREQGGNDPNARRSINVPPRSAGVLP